MSKYTKNQKKKLGSGWRDLLEQQKQNQGYI